MAIRGLRTITCMFARLYNMNWCNLHISYWKFLYTLSRRSNRWGVIPGIPAGLWRSWPLDCSLINSSGPAGGVRGQAGTGEWEQDESETIFTVSNDTGMSTFFFSMYLSHSQRGLKKNYCVNVFPLWSCAVLVSKQRLSGCSHSCTDERRAHHRKGERGHLSFPQRLRLWCNWTWSGSGAEKANNLQVVEVMQPQKYCSLHLNHTCPLDIFHSQRNACFSGIQYTPHPNQILQSTDSKSYLACH